MPTNQQPTPRTYRLSAATLEKLGRLASVVREGVTLSESKTIDAIVADRFKAEERKAAKSK